MNYIKHLNGFFKHVERDERLTVYHISLYVACFQLWNNHRFAKTISINRSDMMRLARIGSVNTYARCMRQLHEWGYIHYVSASNWHQSSRLSCIRFDTTGKTAGDIASDTPFININKQIKEQRNTQDVKTNKDYSEPL